MNFQRFSQGIDIVAAMLVLNSRLRARIDVDQQPADPRRGLGAPRGQLIGQNAARDRSQRGGAR